MVRPLGPTGQLITFEQHMALVNLASGYSIELYRAYTSTIVLTARPSWAYLHG